MVGEWLFTTESQRAQSRTEDGEGSSRFFSVGLGDLCDSVVINGAG